MLEDHELPPGRRVTKLAPALDGVLTAPSSSLERSYATVEVVLTDVLDQFARNFLLNDVSVEQSHKLLEGAKEIRDVHASST